MKAWRVILVISFFLLVMSKDILTLTILIALWLLNFIAYALMNSTYKSEETLNGPR